MCGFQFFNELTSSNWIVLTFSVYVYYKKYFSVLLYSCRSKKVISE